MALFSRDQDSEKLNVHEMQTLWYELHCGMAHLRLGELRLALKQLSYLEKHWNFMFDDCCDFFYCSMRRGTVMHYLQMWDWQQSMYRGKWPIRGCVRLLKVLKRIRRDVCADEAKVAEVKAEHDAFLESEEHKKWLEEWDKKDESLNELRNDPDPKGWQLYQEVIKDPTGYYLQYAEDVCAANPETADVQVKCLDYFIGGGNLAQAIVPAVNIAKLHGTHPKAIRALGKFNTFLPNADASKLSAEAKAQLADFQDNLLPAFEQGKVTVKAAAVSMEHALEFFKLNPGDNKMRKQAGDSLKKDKAAHSKVHVAEKIHKRLRKVGADALAQTFWTAAQALYPQSLYFSDTVEESDKEEEKEPEEDDEEDNDKDSDQ